MIGLLIAATAATLVTAFAEAVHLAIVQTTQGAINRHATEKRVLARAQWISSHLRSIEEGSAIVLMAGRTAVVVLILAMELRDPIEVASFVRGGLIAAAVLWLGTGIIPSALARHAGAKSLIVCVPLFQFMRFVLWPLVQVGNGVELVARRLAEAGSVQSQAESEVLDAVGQCEWAGGIDPMSADMIENIVEFADTTVSEVMTPRTEVEGLEYTDDLAEVRAFVTTVPHSRFPVYDGSLDRIIGVLHIRDLAPFLGTSGRPFRMVDILRHPLRVPETKRVRDLLLDFQKSKEHLAIVVDEFGGTAGLATIEDVLEELVGEIEGEHDHERAEPEVIRQVRPGVWIVPGRTRVDVVNETTELEIPEAADYDTVAGFVLDATGRIPVVGETLHFDGFSVVVRQATPSRIVELEVFAKGAIPATPASSPSPSR
ncbi:MAG: hemolysin family protein [Planctomycetota bacterium]|nr:hemolysin family protein [Planctomycetota bacterium]